MNCYKLLDWIDIDKLNWQTLSSNPNAIHLLEQNPHKIDWFWLSENPNAIHLLEQNLDEINWGWFTEMRLIGVGLLKIQMQYIY